MTSDSNLIRLLGMDPPILADGWRVPDRREISLRWLTGTFLTGITSSVLMGVALFAALDGRQQLAIPAEAFALSDMKLRDTDSAQGVQRGGRLITNVISSNSASRSVLDVSTMTRVGDKDVVKRQPFTHLKMLISASLPTQESYPPFDPLTIFGSDDATVSPRTGTIYGSNVDSEVSLKTIPFPTSQQPFKLAPGMTSDEVEENVRSNGSLLTEGAAQVSALYYVDPQRFADEEDLAMNPGLSARVVEQNLSVAAPDPVTSDTEQFADDIIPIRREQAISAALTNSGYPAAKAQAISDSLTDQLKSPNLKAGDVLRIGIIQRGEEARVVRFSVYRGGKHLITMAVNDKGKLEQGDEPPMLDQVASAFDENSQPMTSGRDLPSIYDGIYRAALSYGMGKDLAGQVVRLLAGGFDLQAPLKPTDGIEAMYSAADSSGKASSDSELLFLRARFGETTTTLYRFQDPTDGSVDYFDENGKTNRQFLLRNPVPNGVFRSGFGMRRHPILGFARMHTGVDWGATSGSPIVAAGNGVVEKAGWDSGGYGNQTIIRHPNGYESSYNHQSAIAKGVVPGAKIRQGQVIGWVGTTGESTGPHLHYEIIVNGVKVDPMKVRLPDGKSLDGKLLSSFEVERKRIDDLLASDDKNRQLAANN